MKLSKWISKHLRLTTALTGIPLVLIYTFLMKMIDWPTWCIILVDCFLLLLAFSFPQSCLNRVILHSCESLNKNCDPEPLLQTTTELLAYAQPENIRQILLINQSLAFREMGEYQKAADILNSINIDKTSSTLPITKITYYNNLSDIYDLLDKTAQADIWYEKMVQIYYDMPENAAKKQIKDALESASAAYQYRKGNYQKTIDILSTLHTQNMAHNIDSALRWAQASLKLGDIQTARAKLNYVIENGNKLHSVTLAKQMLDDLS